MPACTLGLVLLLLGQAFAVDAVTARFKETDELFANPGKGWLAPAWRREPRFPASVAYFRLNWMDIEPAQGQVRWDIIDKHIRTCAPRRGRIAFRIMTANAHTKGYYCSPKWLFDLGCKSTDYLRGGEDTMAGGIRIKRIEPDYADPLFLEHHGRFIAELAKRYDGHPGVEFLDIGSYGIWGEWHSANGKPWAIRKQIIDMYLDGFQKTPLVQMSDDAEALAYAISKGAGYRRDGVGSPWHEKTWIGS
ncbi:beta-galactosidase, partial [bacterium]|nr:beta-galactosidase [bacterium]